MWRWAAPGAVTLLMGLCGQAIALSAQFEATTLSEFRAADPLQRRQALGQIAAHVGVAASTDVLAILRAPLSAVIQRLKQMTQARSR
jgi:hypothetical protein